MSVPKVESGSWLTRGRGASLPRPFWFGAALLVFLVSSWIAFRQEPHPDAYRQANPAQLDWWLHPIESNADRRLPRVWADLNDVYALKGTRHVWTVGNGGLILHSADDGRNWTRRYLVDSQDEPPPAEKGAESVGRVGRLSPRSPGTAQRNSPEEPSPSAPPLQPQEPALALREVANSDLYGVHFVDDRNGWVAGDNGALFSTMDGGRTWTRSETGAGREAFRAIFFLDRSEGWVLGPKDVPLYTRDRGVTWESVRAYRLDINDPSSSLTSVFVTVTQSAVPGGAECFLRKLRYSFCVERGKGPSSLSRLQFLDLPTSRIPLQPLQNGVRPISFEIVDQQGWAVTGEGVLLYKGEYSVSWQRRDIGPGVEPRAISFSDPQRGWIAGSRGTLLATGDGGQTWRRASRSLPDLPELAALAEVPLSHRIWPAPWYFLSLGFVGLLLAPAMRSPKPDVISESVADLLISDRPISTGDHDVFDFKRVALGLSRFLRNEKTVPPLTIAVTGEWGTGKSSLMNLLQGDLKRYGFRPVWFNAWHHQKEEHLLASLLATVRSQAVPPWWRPEGAIFRLRLLYIRWKRFWPLIAFLLVVFSFSLGYFRSHPGQLDTAWSSVKAIPSVVADPGSWLRERGSKASAPWIALLISGSGLVVSLWKGLKGFGVNPASLLARDSARTRVSDLEKLTGFRHQFAAEFRDITHALNPRTMVVMIDDLDRCRPEMVLEVLESVNFLISSGDCFVVLGMARERVIRCVGLSFKDVASELLVTQAHPEEKSLNADELARKRRIEFAHQYLEKLINIEVPVPSPTDEQSRQLLRDGAQGEKLPESHRDRVWRVVWRGVQKALPAAAAVGLLLLGYWMGAAQIGGGDPGLREVLVVAAETKAQDPVEPPAATLEEPPAENAIRRSPAKWDRPEESRHLISLAVVLLAALLGLGVWRLSVPPGVVIRDSKEFEDALEAWHPLVFTFRNTPRSIKRFLNRVRYLAMLQRRPEPEASRWRQILAWLQGLFRRGKEKHKTTETSSGIPEHALVALVAIEHARPDWFEEDRFFTNPWVVAGMALPEKLQAIIYDTPLSSYREAYLHVSRGIQVR